MVQSQRNADVTGVHGDIGQRTRRSYHWRREMAVRMGAQLLDDVRNRLSCRLPRDACKICSVSMRQP